MNMKKKSSSSKTSCLPTQPVSRPARRSRRKGNSNSHGTEHLFSGPDRLPNEISLEVSSYLNNDELLNLRSTCHQLETQTFLDFVDRFLKHGHVSFSMTRRSVEDLVWISKYPRFKQYIRRLYFVIHTIPRHEIIEKNMGRRNKSAPAVKEYLLQRRALLLVEQTPGLDFSLVQAFNNFENIKTLSYGIEYLAFLFPLAQISNKFDVHVREMLHILQIRLASKTSPEAEAFQNSQWQLRKVLLCIAESNMRPKYLTGGCRSYSNRGLPYAFFGYPLQAKQARRIHSALQDLSSIAIHLRELTYSIPNRTGSTIQDRIARSFKLLTRRLDSLSTLNLVNLDSVWYPTTSGSIFEELLKRCFIPSLKVINLDGLMSLRVSTLESFFSVHPLLENIQISQCVVAEEEFCSWKSILESLQKHEVGDLAVVIERLMVKRFTFDNIFRDYLLVLWDPKLSDPDNLDDTFSTGFDLSTVSGKEERDERLAKALKPEGHRIEKLEGRYIQLDV